MHRSIMEEQQMTKQISLNLTLEELEIIDKYIELNDDTRQLFDKIRSAYPKSPVETAYKRVFGEYPPTDPSVHNFDDNQWFAFQKGYSCGYGDILKNDKEEKLLLKKIFQEERERQEENERIERNLKTSLQELSNGDVRPIADVVKEAKKELVEKPTKKFLDVLDDIAFPEWGTVDKPEEKQSKTLTDIVYRWWDDVFAIHSDWDMETSIEDLVDQVEQWLPKQTDVCEEYSYETGRNSVIGVIKRNLR